MKHATMSGVRSYKESLDKALKFFKEALENEFNKEKLEKLIRDIDNHPDNFWGYHDHLTYGLHLLRNFQSEDIRKYALRHFQDALSSIKDKELEADLTDPSVAINKLIKSLTNNE